MNEHEIEIQPPSFPAEDCEPPPRRVSYRKQLSGFFGGKDDYDDDATAKGGNRRSCGASFFNSILMALGIRVPHQSLYDVRDGLVTKVRRGASVFRLYTLFVLACLCVLPVRSFTKMLDSYSDETFLHFVADMVLPVQYALAIVYFGSDHLQLFYDVVKPVLKQRRRRRSDRQKSRTLANIREIFVDIKLEDRKTFDFDVLVKHPCRLTIRIVSWITTTALVVSFVGAVLTSSVGEYDVYYLFFLVSRLHGRGTCIVNTASFAFVFYKHVKVLGIYGRMLEKRDWSAQKYDRVSVMLINLTRIRESLKVSTDAFKNIYSTATIAGCMIVGVLIHSTTINASYRWAYDSFVIVGSFALLQSILFSVIARLSLSKERIEDVTRSSVFASNFLSRRVSDDPSRVTLENASALDYWLMTDILAGEWLDFKVMGMPVHSMAFLKQCVSFVSILLVIANTKSLQLAGVLDDD